LGGETRKGGGLREVLSMTLSVLAFILSIGTAYFTIVRQLDELSLVIPTFPAIMTGSNYFEVNNFDLTFMNSGTRAAVIELIYLAVDQQSPGDTPTNCSKGVTVGVDLLSLTIKEGDIVTKTFQAQPAGTGQLDQHGIKVPLLDENISRGVFPLEVCLGLQIFTPSQARLSKTVSVLKADAFSVTSGFTSTSHVTEPMDRIPLIRKIGTIFYD
jgi:hypothetical protein